MHTQGNSSPRRRKLLFAGLWTSLGAFLIMIIYPIWRFIMPPKIPESRQTSVNLGSIDSIEPNSAKLFGFGNRPAILIRLPDGEFRAFSAVCTHLQCTVQYRKDFKLIWCACHNARFDLNGSVVSGPPPTGLEKFEVNISNNEIIVSKGI